MLWFSSGRSLLPRNASSPWLTATTCLQLSPSCLTSRWCSGGSAGFISTPSLLCSSTWCSACSFPSSWMLTKQLRFEFHFNWQLWSNFTIFQCFYQEGFPKSDLMEFVSHCTEPASSSRFRTDSFTNDPSDLLKCLWCCRKYADKISTRFLSAEPSTYVSMKTFNSFLP